VWNDRYDSAFVNGEFTLVLALITALTFVFTNQFHETGNATAGSRGQQCRCTASHKREKE